MAEGKSRLPYSFWVEYFRRCRVNEHTVEITPPLLFGRGYIFDRDQRTLSMSRHFLRIPLSKIDVPFLRVTYVWVDKITHPPAYDDVPILERCNVMMRVSGYSNDIKIASFPTANDPEVRADRMVAAVREAIRDVADLTYVVKREIYKIVVEEPGISHTQLLQNAKLLLNVETKHGTVEAAIRELLDEDELKFEQRGPVRKYSVPGSIW